ncbi:DUF3488 and DUF4129 domain-containing transglutaminase family protein [Alkalihalophilus sp. As8PL]|uniref:DUF3488 and DUF4129 domain-containing transglutaminase family protein n=1 Tax=Alkalihalophilus sp. As8PL TaxID=3237103 RepID=A0AB39BYE4_9BACI
MKLIMKKKQIDLSRDLFLYGLSFVLLLEWLWPLPHITNTGFINIFVLVTALYFILTFLQLPVYVSLPIKALVTVYGLFLVFFEGPLFTTEWLELLIADFWLNLGYMFSGQWYALTDLFRSLLFFILLAIMSYLLFYWTVYARRVLFFLVFTVIYVTIIDTFTLYDATYAIVRTFVIGFLLMGLVAVYRITEKEEFNYVPSFLPVKIGLVLIVLIASASTLGLLSPKPEPQWDDPIPYVRAAVGLEDSSEEGGEGEQRIGYGDNDEQLGGGFVDDNTPLFYAAVQEGHYWRGETKDFYTGRGWETTTPTESASEPSLEQLQSDGATFFRRETEVIFAGETSRRYPHLFYGGTLLNYSTVENADLLKDQYTERVDTSRNGTPVELDNYRIEYAYPEYDIAGLREASGSESEDLDYYYTQLPEELPDRVRELALELTEEEETRYDQAKAIEQYFQSPEFTYETEDVPVPEEGEDYVDQFLFETQRGYCDNFSTSMVVLLRSLDIPARWVKGFTQGEEVEALDDGLEVYEVTNGNAHSWVEVHFPGVGWVPFEPTRGFDSTYDFLEAEDEGNDELELPDTDQEEDQEVEDVFADLEGAEESPANNSNQTNGAKLSGSTLVTIIFTLLFASLVGVFRKKIARLFILLQFKYKANQDGVFQKAYHRLLWLLGYIGYKRQSGETLREYAIRIDQSLGSNDMVSLTEEYERIYYGQKESSESWEHFKNNWIRILGQINS